MQNEARCPNAIAATGRTHPTIVAPPRTKGAAVAPDLGDKSGCSCPWVMASSRGGGAACSFSPPSRSAAAGQTARGEPPPPPSVTAATAAAAPSAARQGGSATAPGGATHPAPRQSCPLLIVSHSSPSFTRAAAFQPAIQAPAGARLPSPPARPPLPTPTPAASMAHTPASRAGGGGSRRGRRHLLKATADLST